MSISGLSKAFPGTRALDAVALELRHGEVHALCGGNGSGKSTLIKVVSGVYSGDAGTISVGDEEIDVTATDPDKAHGAGVRVVHQDLAVFGDMTVAENMMLGSKYPTHAGHISWGELREEAEYLSERFAISARPDTLLRDLPMATRTQVALARALRDADPDHGVVVLDEPTAALPVHEAKILHEVIRLLAARGHAVLLVSHRLDEVMELTDRVTVFVDGRLHSEHVTAEITESVLIEAITGRSSTELSERRRAIDVGDVVLASRDLSAGPIRGVSIELSAGEIVGVAGLLGSGRTELLRALCGDLKLVSGHVELNGAEVSVRTMTDAIRRGIVMVPEDRTASGVFSDLSVQENISISVLGQYWNKFTFRRRSMREDTDALIRRFRIKTPSGSTLISSLSGGNQQKVVLARWLRRKPSVLLLDEPTQGVDVGARFDIYAAVREATEGGACALVVASDFEELAQICDRVLLMREGDIVGEVSGAQLTAQHLNELLYS